LRLDSAVLDDELITRFVALIADEVRELESGRGWFRAALVGMWSIRVAGEGRVPDRAGGWFGKGRGVGSETSMCDREDTFRWDWEDAAEEEGWGSCIVAAGRRDPGYAPGPFEPRLPFDTTLPLSVLSFRFLASTLSKSCSSSGSSITSGELVGISCPFEPMLWRRGVGSDAFFSTTLAKRRRVGMGVITCGGILFALGGRLRWLEDGLRIGREGVECSESIGDEVEVVVVASVESERRESEDVDGWIEESGWFNFRFGNDGFGLGPATIPTVSCVSSDGTSGLTNLPPRSPSSKLPSDRKLPFQLRNIPQLMNPHIGEEDGIFRRIEHMP